MLRDVILDGALGRKFGRLHRISVKTSREAVKAMCVRIPGFEKYFSEAHLNGVRFAFFVNGRNIGMDRIDMSSANSPIRIMPVAEGSKNGGFLQVVIGAVLIVAGIFVTTLSGSLAAPIGAGLIGAGVGMATGGVIQLLSPQPRGLSMGQDADNKPNYAFGAPVNSVAQGNPIPMGYGYREIGGAVLSAEITVEDFA